MRTASLSLCALLLLGATARAEPLGAGLSSPMMNRAIFQDGQVQRFTGRFGAWTVVCDEVASLKQRYCSLRSSNLDIGGGRTAYVDVSTGDDGKPAALLHLPLTVSVAFGVKVAEPTSPRHDKIRKLESHDDPRHSLTVVTCTARECLAVWSLHASDIQALTAGRGVVLTFCTTRPGALEFAADLRVESCQAKLAGFLPSAGFKEAVAASIK